MPLAQHGGAGWPIISKLVAVVVFPSHFFGVTYGKDRSATFSLVANNATHLDCW